MEKGTKQKKVELKGKIRDDELPEVPDGTSRNKVRQSGLSFWDKRKLKKKGDVSFLIKMFFSNGTCKEFVIATEKETFRYRKRTYYLRYEDSWFNLTQNQFELHYFDDVPVPLDKNILKKGNRAFWSVTPKMSSL